MLITPPPPSCFCILQINSHENSVPMLCLPSIHPAAGAVVQQLQEGIQWQQVWDHVYVSSNEDEKSFQEYYSEMPWLALPFAQ